MRKNYSKLTLAQAAMEYLIIASIILGALLAVDFIGSMRGVFNNFFNKAVEEMK
jgi:hypothetical protein